MALEMRELLKTMPQVGVVEWISIRPQREEPVQELDSVEVTPTGLSGDHFGGKPGAKRSVTLIQQEHIAAVASILQKDSIAPGDLRRNLVVSGINLQALKDNHFKIGNVILFGTGNCPPCSRMEQNLGPGGYNAMRGHGGITARVVSIGTISIGDQVRMLSTEDVAREVPAEEMA